jgi:hypothetical protein
VLQKHLGERAATRIRASEQVKNQFEIGGQPEKQVNDKSGDDNYSVHEDCSIVNVPIARRCKFQLIASIYYLLNFHMRKLERKSDLFMGHRTLKEMDLVEADYDETLDAMVTALKSNYKEWNEIVDLQKLKEENENEFEKA